MLARLSIRDIVLIDRLDIDFASGLSVLTGETGAGKSILLDAFALALGARGDVTLVREGAEQGQVTAAFELPSGHPVRAIMAENDIPAEHELILRRVQFTDGRTRAFVNDQPLSARWWIRRRTAACSMPSGRSTARPQRWSGFGTSGAHARAR